MPIITTASGVLTVGSFGSSANTFCAGNDTRLTTTNTWNPTIMFGGVSTGVVYSTQTGTWVKTAYGYLLTGRIVLSNKGSATGNVTIGGLPESASASNAATCVIVPISGMSSLTVGGCILGYIAASANTITLYAQSATGVTNLTDANFTSTSSLAFSIYYKV